MNDTDVISFSHAPGQDYHAHYFEHLESVLRLVLEVFVCASKDRKRSFEANALQSFCRNFLNTVEVMRLKYTYNPSDQLSIDIANSGFPSFVNFDSIELDLRTRDSRLAKLPPADTLKSAILDRLLISKADPRDILWRLSERVYLENLKARDLFFSFKFGKLQKNNENDEKRNYSITWSCFDEPTNRPIVYLMNFDQDKGEALLEDEDVNFYALIETLKRQSTGNRGLLYVATGIDEAISEIHPKLLKRIQIGPICSLDYSKNPADLYKLLQENGENHEPIVFFDDEIIMSIEQKRSGKLLSLEKIREVFLVPEIDLECYTKKVSQIHHYLILPHRIHQLLDFTGMHNAYSNHTIIPYIGKEKGEVYAENCRKLFTN